VPINVWIGLLIVVLLGVVSSLFPLANAKFVQIQAIGKTGISEIRATYGGIFLGMALTALILQQLEVAFALGIGFASAAVIRALSALLEHARAPDNLAGIGFEGLIAVLLLVR
jgi:hypothetical protein